MAENVTIMKDRLHAIRSLADAAISGQTWFSNRSVQEAFDPVTVKAMATLALQALEAHAHGGVTVKPLVWSDWALGGVIARMNDPLEYSIEKGVQHYRVYLDRGRIYLGAFDSAEEAKAAAQADYEARILSTLAPQPPASGHVPSVQVDTWDIEKTAGGIARELARIDGGRLHGDIYQAALAGALEGLKCAREHVRASPDHEPRQEAVDGIWPPRLTLRDTKVHADEGQRIFTTATGYGYEKREYVRADLAHPSPQPSVPAMVVNEAMVERAAKAIAASHWADGRHFKLAAHVENTWRLHVQDARVSLTAALRKE